MLLTLWFSSCGHITLHILTVVRSYYMLRVDSCLGVMWSCGGYVVTSHVQSVHGHVICHISAQLSVLRELWSACIVDTSATKKID